MLPKSMVDICWYWMSDESFALTLMPYPCRKKV